MLSIAPSATARGFYLLAPVCISYAVKYVDLAEPRGGESQIQRLLQRTVQTNQISERACDVFSTRRVTPTRTSTCQVAQTCRCCY